MGPWSMQRALAWRWLYKLVRAGSCQQEARGHSACVHGAACTERAGGRAPEAEKQWCSGDRYAFSCTVDLLDVRHLPRQYSNTLPQCPVSGLPPDAPALTPPLRRLQRERTHA